MKGKKELLELLQELAINYKSYTHPPIMSVNDGEIYAKNIPGTHCKNLFLTDTKENLYLVVLPVRKRLDLKKLAIQLNSSRLSFASPAALKKHLGILPGCVTPFALINATGQTIVVLLDRDMAHETAVNFHPLLNTETITIDFADLLRFIDFCGQNRNLIAIS
jgi:Ala-tRNA(Pro) deacylase